MSSKIALIRHGAYQQKEGAPSAWQPYPLTEDGKKGVIKEIDQFKFWLHSNQFVLAPQVYCSPLLRAWQTAQIYMEHLLADFAAPPVTIETDALSERCVGSVANLTTDEIEHIMARDPRYSNPPENWKSNSRYRLPFPGAESLLEAGQRVADFIEQKHTQTGSQQPDNWVQLVVGHGASIRHGACHLNVIKFCDVASLSMYHAHPVVIEKKSDRWQHLSGHWKVRETGSVAKD